MIRIKLSEVMGRLRIKQSELIRRTGIRPGTINNLYYERTLRLEIEHLNRLCEALECQPGDLLEYVPDEPKK
ncbi:MAG TPA: helix-turn-helix transcriptional regulator [Syntrophomonadaceae bacterium]|jgi:putative transcriptional regulator|nr:helix-turn-helix transcriptional regulator [Syntrophomonadaceae bacterium]HPF44454.1 helix-turn-helix transcriptional regulator [Syntrophomonadaceae bacterium]